MASDVLQDLVRALCSLDIVEPPAPKRVVGAPSTSALRNASASEARKEAAPQAA